MIFRIPHVMRTLLLLLMALVFALPVLADYYDGLREWDAGRHREALVKWQEAAGEGDARSMIALGTVVRQRVGGATGLHRSAQMVQSCCQSWFGGSHCRA